MIPLVMEEGVTLEHRFGNWNIGLAVGIRSMK